jgi:dTDP-glucose 4,6-dehydratase
MTNPLANDLEYILENSASFWEEIRGERIFISGATGFFGCWLLESFLWANDRLKLKSEAVILTRDYHRFKDKAPHLAQATSVQVITGDVRSFNFPAGTFTHIIHAATDSIAWFNSNNPLLLMDTIITGTQRMLEFAGQARAKKFLLTSSGAVYGNQPVDLPRISEDYFGTPNQLDTKSTYGLAKRMAEHLCVIQREQQACEVKIARCFAFVGPYLPLDWHFAIGNFIRDGLNGGPIIIKGDGTPKRSYLYAADLVIWLWKILSSGKAITPYNVGSDEALSILETADMVAKQFEKPIKVDILVKADPQKPAQRYIPDISLARNQLNLKPGITLPDGIKRTIKYYERKNANRS